ncbi:polysaccharide pyruvyl transferase family protein [Enterococcus sp. BWB1-3]|uniref:polysaccharide pyruvyl transferase family protein n=1 Tax=Enterococcus sp. BWB1-3 TaxID=2787713 RepID=UPI001924BBD6|nr:polysaccharide pyruvyl transferase family protein [Enterococcus sp. BWB1-3]
MKILLLSFTNSSNFGDQLIVKQIIKTCEKYGSVITYSYSFQKNYSFNDDQDYFFLNSKANLESYLKKVYKDYFRNFYLIDKMHTYKNYKKMKNNIVQSEFLNDLKEADLLIIGGGNTIFDLSRNSKNFERYEYIVNIAHQYNTKVMMMCVGLGPFQTSNQEQGTQAVIQKCDFVTVRDNKSYEYGKNITHVHLSVDPVFFLENEKIKQVSNAIGICVIDYRLNNIKQKEYKKYLEEMKSIIERLRSEIPDNDILLFSSEPRDYEAVKDLYNMVKGNKNIELRKISTKEQLITFYNEIDVLLGTRMHSMIVAVSQGVPIVGISWQQKVTEMFKLMRDSESSFEIAELERHTDNIVKSLKRKLENSSLEIEKLEEFKSSCKERFIINLKILSEVKKFKK